MLIILGERRPYLNGCLRNSIDYEKLVYDIIKNKPNISIPEIAKELTISEITARKYYRKANGIEPSKCKQERKEDNMEFNEEELAVLKFMINLEIEDTKQLIIDAKESGEASDAKDLKQHLKLVEGIAKKLNA